MVEFSQLSTEGILLDVPDELDDRPLGGSRCFLYSNALSTKILFVHDSSPSPMFNEVASCNFDVERGIVNKGLSFGSETMVSSCLENSYFIVLLISSSRGGLFGSSETCHNNFEEIQEF